MEELAEKGCARKCDDKGPDGKTWYVPHQGVLNKNKGKMRVAFDFSSQYKETSINENLLSQPDLTNQLVRVLIRFRVGPVTFMAGIQAMFYQVKQRSFLRFLRWKKGNLHSEIAFISLGQFVLLAVATMQ